MIYETVEQLREACEYWKSVLRLSDWDVVVKLGRVYDIGDECQGKCTWKLTRREAVIDVLDHQDWDPACAFQQDQEATLVHELLHLHLSPVFNDDNRAAAEQAIHAISLALVSVRRAEKEL